MIGAARDDSATSRERRASRVGVAVQGSGLRAVGVRGRGDATRVCWAMEGEIDSGEALAHAVRELLAGAPLRRWPPAEVIIALGGHHGQVKPLHGLPSVRNVATVADVVGATPSRFFFRNGVPVVAGGVRFDADGAAWGTAFAAPLVGQLVTAVRDAQARLASLTTLPVALASALREDAPGQELEYEDEDGPIVSSYHSGRLIAQRRVDATTATRAAPSWSPPLTTLGDGAPRFAAAYGAAVLAPDEPLVLRSPAERRGRGTRRLVLAASVATIAIVAALLLPLLRAERLERSAFAALTRHGPRYAAALRDEARLAAADAALREAAAFDARRQPRLLLLERLTAALPDGAALVSLRADSAEVAIVVVGPRMSVITAALERAREFSGLALVGAVSREVTGNMPGGRELERASYRFRFTSGAR